MLEMKVYDGTLKIRAVLDMVYKQLPTILYFQHFVLGSDRMWSVKSFQLFMILLCIAYMGMDE